MRAPAASGFEEYSFARGMNFKPAHRCRDARVHTRAGHGRQFRPDPSRPTVAIKPRPERTGRSAASSRHRVKAEVRPS
jgi:hypothetical protein